MKEAGRNTIVRYEIYVVVKFSYNDEHNDNKQTNLLHRSQVSDSGLRQFLYMRTVLYVHSRKRQVHHVLQPTALHQPPTL